MNALRTIDAVCPVTVKPRLPDIRYCELHSKHAAGTIASDELAELDMMCAEKEREWEEIQRAESTHNREAGSAEQAPAANQ